MMEHRKILVIGDPIVDRYVYGTVDRLCPEAPVPVLVETSTRNVPGGAWNAFLNLQTCTEDCFFVGSIGAIGADQRFLEENLFFDRDNFYVVYANSKFPLKTRFVSNGHLLLRLDSERFREPLDIVDQKYVARSIKEILDRITPEVILISDYAYGTINPLSVEAIREYMDDNEDVIVIVDPHPTQDFRLYKGCRYLLPNESEYAGISPSFGDWTDETFVVKRGGNPVHIMAVDANGEWKLDEEIPVFAVPNLIDPCGAGDTFAAYFAAMIANPSSSLTDAVRCASAAASIAVSMPGTVVVHPLEFCHLFPMNL